MRTLIRITLTLLFIIYCSNAQVMTQTTAQMPPYTNLTAAQVKANPQVQALVQLGLTQIISLGQAKKQFNSTNFIMATVDSAARQPVSKGNNFKLNVHYVNTKNESVHAKITGFFNMTSGKPTISALTYSVQYPKKATIIAPPSTTPPTSNMTLLDVNQVKTNSFVKGLFDFGLNTAIGLGIKDGSIPNAKYTVSKVNSITKQDLKNGEVYTFNVVAKSPANKTLALAFIVRGQLDAYSFKVQ